jgi:hypothetical protein
MQLLKKKLKAAADRQEALLASRKTSDGNSDESKHEKVCVLMLERTLKKP